MLPTEFLVTHIAQADAYDYIAKGGVDGYVAKTTKTMYNYLRPLNSRWDHVAWDGVPGDGGSFQHDLWDDCQQEVRTWCVEAASLFDPYKGTKFSTWCMVHIKLRLLACLSKAKVRGSKDRIFRKSCLRETRAIFAGQQKATADKVRRKMSREDLDLWETVISRTSEWGRSIENSRSLPKWKGDPAKMIAKRTGLPYPRLKGLFKAIREMESEVADEGYVEPEHYRNGQRIRGKVFA